MALHHYTLCPRFPGTCSDCTPDKPSDVRRAQGAETTASESRPAHRPHVFSETWHRAAEREWAEAYGAREYLTGPLDEMSPDERLHASCLGVGENMTDARAKWSRQGQPRAAFRPVCKVPGCTSPCDDSDAYCDWHGPCDMPEADWSPAFSRDGWLTALETRAPRFEGRPLTRDDARYHLTDAGIRALQADASAFGSEWSE